MGCYVKWLCGTVIVCILEGVRQVLPITDGPSVYIAALPRQIVPD